MKSEKFRQDIWYEYFKTAIACVAAISVYFTKARTTCLQVAVEKKVVLNDVDFFVYSRKQNSARIFCLECKIDKYQILSLMHEAYFKR